MATRTYIQLDGSEVELDTKDIASMDKDVKGDHESASTEFISIVMENGRVYQVLPPEPEPKKKDEK